MRFDLRLQNGQGNTIGWFISETNAHKAQTDTICLAEIHFVYHICTQTHTLGKII